MQSDVLIIGGGLAGMSAAIKLVDAGLSVRLLEANPYLGGRTSSWNEDGMLIESGLHRFLGFYTALPDLLHTAGVSLNDILCWEDEVEIRTPEKAHAVMGASPLHKPLKTAASLLGNNDFLTPADKLSLGKMFAAASQAYAKDALALDEISVLDFARQHDVTEQAIKRALIPVTEGIFFLPIARYSMFNLMGLVVPYLKTLPKMRVGAFLGGMSDVMMAPLATYATSHGASIHTSQPADELIIEDGRVRGVISKGTTYKATHTIVATSLHGAQELLRPQLQGESSLHGLFALPTMPAVTFQMELRQPSMEVDRTTFGPGTALAAFAEQSRTTFRASPGRLSVILSPPEQFLDMPDDDILDVVMADAKRLGLHLADTVVSYRTVRLPHDFYSLATGSERLRPPQKTDVPGLIVAGDYTKQPYLATMEGAVVSGRLAAEIVTTS